MNSNELNTFSPDGENVVSDTYVVIEIWARPLAKRHYYASEIRNRRLDGQNSGSSLLTETLRQNPNIRRLSASPSQRAAKQVAGAVTPVNPEPKPVQPVQRQEPEKSDEYFDLGSRILSETPQEFLKPKMPNIVPDNYDNGINEAEQLSEAEPKKKNKPKKISIKVKLRNALYDYTEIKLEEMEEKVDELINQDGFYDEVVPIDTDVEYHKKSVIDMRFVVLFAALAIVTAAIIYVFKSF